MKDVTAIGRQYSDLVREHYLRPRNVGALPQQSNVGRGQAGSQNEGGLVQFQVQVDHSGIIKAVRFKAYGCGATIAAASWVGETISELALAQAQTLGSNDVAKALALPPKKIHCAMLVCDALQAAIADYKSKQESSWISH